MGPEQGRPIESQVLHEVKVSCSQTRYKPTWTDRAVDKRAKTLQQEYITKARNADRKYNGVEEGVVGPTERKLLQLGEVRGVVAGNWGEVSEATHALLAHLATSRVRVAGPTRGKKGLMRSEEAERATAISSLRRRLGVATVRAQCHSLLGRLETLGPGTLLLQTGAGRLQRRTGDGGGKRRLIAWPHVRGGAATELALPKWTSGPIHMIIRLY